VAAAVADAGHLEIARDHLRHGTPFTPAAVAERRDGVDLVDVVV
jgi:hypothetical protein